MKNPPYTVEQESGGCDKCNHGALFLIVGPDDVGLSTLYEDKESAKELCELLNFAFYQGYNRKKYETP